MEAIDAWVPGMKDAITTFDPNRSLRFHYQSLDQQSRRIYKMIYDAVSRMDDSVSIPSSEIYPDTDLFSIYAKVRMDNPLLFWMNNELEMKADKKHNELIFKNLYSKEDAKVLTKKIIDSSVKIRDIVMKYAKDDYEIELAIHDLLAVNIDYKDPDDPESHNIIGPLLKKKGVCEGISMTVEHLLNCFGIRSTVVTGNVIDVEDSNHAWNIVILGDHAYHTDVTWDLCSKAGWAGHTFLNVSDEFMRRSREWECPLICDGTEFNYFDKNGTSFDSISKAKKYLRRNRNANQFEFRIKDCFDSNQVIEIISGSGLTSEFVVRNTPDTDVFFVHPV